MVGTHGRRGLGRLLLGSGAESILRTAPMPVLLVRTPGAVAASEPAQGGTRIHQPTAALSIE